MGTNYSYSDAINEFEDDGVICPRCVKGRSVLITNGKKTRNCFDFDEVKTEEKP